MGVTVNPDDLAMRVNLICIEDGKIKNHSAGHISSEESHVIVKDLQKELGSEQVRFHPGVSYRHLLLVKDGVNEIACTPPHDVPGTPFREVMVQATGPKGEETAALLNDLILESQELLRDHPVNRKRIESGRDPGNSIWMWAPGYKPQMKTLKELYGLSGAVISAVDLIKGIGVYAGLEVIEVEGATGLYDTNYEGKAQAALDALKRTDFVYLHIEASDEAGHEGDYELKTRTIEYLDQRVVKTIMEETAKMNEPVTIALIPDHPTPCEVRTHVHDAVPFIIYRQGEDGDDVRDYNEESVKQGYYGTLEGNAFIRAVVG